MKIDDLLRDEDAGWTELHLLIDPLSPAEAEQVRTSIARDRPLGTARWVESTARRLGLEWTLHGRGRPRNPRRSPSRAPSVRERRP